MHRLLFAPVHASSLAAYRILFGMLGFVGLIRFWYLGWIERCFIRPEFFFKYPGFSWLEVWPGNGMYIHFALLIVVSFSLALGLFTRVMSVLFFFGFSYIELLDQSNYLNHYYLVMLLAFINIFLPLGALWSVDNLTGISKKREWVPAWTLNWLRFQVGAVYFFAGLAKLGPDWLLEAQPLNIWLTAQRDIPIIGWLLEERWSHFAMSWAGFLFDTTIVAWLLFARTRPYAYLAVIFFHAMTYLLFPIGLFPFIMILMALVFFPSDWPMKLLNRPTSLWSQYNIIFPYRTTVVVGLALYVSVQIAMPFRHLLYPGDVLWNEEGMRFSWKVMVREKNGEATFRVKDKASGRWWLVSPSLYLRQHQQNEMAITPDMILQFAHFLKDEFKRKGFEVEVFAETMTSFNGRLAKPIVDPKVDLASVEPTLMSNAWILPAPEGRPHHLTFKRSAR